MRKSTIYSIHQRFSIGPATVAVDSHSGLAGIAHWLNSFYDLKDDDIVDKKHAVVQAIKNIIDPMYLAGRNTVMGDGELESILQEVDEDYYLVLTDKKTTRA